MTKLVRSLVEIWEPEIQKPKWPFIARASAHQYNLAPTDEEACGRWNSQNTHMYQNTLNWHPIPCVVHTPWQKRKQKAQCLVASFLHGQKHVAVTATNHTDGCQLAGTTSRTSFLWHCLGMLLFCRHSEERRMSKEQHAPPMDTACTRCIVNTFWHVNMHFLLYVLAPITSASSEHFLTANVSSWAEDQWTVHDWFVHKSTTPRGFPFCRC